MTYAIIESGGKQYRAEKGAKLVVDRLPEKEGAKVTLRPVLFRADKDVVLDGKELEKVKVEAVVAEHLRGEKVRIFKYRRKKGYRRRAGHRQELSRLEVTDVKMLTRKPAAKADAEGAAKPKAGAEGAAKPKAGAAAAAKTPATTKAPAKKPAARKPAAKPKPKASDS
jgi:large subunit ribosomal protein L21